VGQGTTVIFTLPNRPPEKKVVQDNNEVGNEISRLAQDIADVLTHGEIESFAPTSVPVPTAPTSFVPHAAPAQPVPPVQVSPAPIRKNPAA